MKSHRTGIRGTLGRMAATGTLLRVQASDPMVASIVADAFLLGLWGYLRLANRPLTLAELSAATRLDPALTQRKLDVLASYDIVQTVPSTSRRRSIAYRALHQGLQVHVPRNGKPGVTRDIQASARAHVCALLERNQPGRNGRDAWTWHADFAGVFNMKPQETEELRRRLDRVAEYANTLGAKYAARGTMPALCNYALSFRVEPLQSHTLPLAPVQFVLAGSRQRPQPRSRRTVELARREREVALALCRGMTAKEVGSLMGIQRSTVATMTKRIYAKLGVHRRAQLVSRLQETLAAPVVASTRRRR